MKRKSNRNPMAKERKRNLSKVEQALLDAKIAVLDKNNHLVITGEIPKEITAMKQKNEKEAAEAKENKILMAKLKIKTRRLQKKAA